MTNTDQFAAIQSLLSEVDVSLRALRRAKELFANQLAPEFNIFDSMRVDEMWLSRCIAGLLDSNGKHGQGALFLNLFTQRFLPYEWARKLTLRQIQLEKVTEKSRRIDIYLQYQGGELIAIENKPWAGDQDNQLHDYASFLQRQAQGKNWHLFYLSNGEVSINSLSRNKRKDLEEEGRFSVISFYELVDWLEACVLLTQATSVRLFIADLVKFIRQEINGELDMSEQNEIKGLVLQSRLNLESAFQLQKVMHALKVDLLADFKADLNDKLTVAGFELVWDEAMTKAWKAYAGFGVRFHEGHVLHMRYEFSATGLQDLIWGLRRDNKLIPKIDTNWKALNAEVSAEFGSGELSQWWPWWNRVESSLEWERDANNWGTNAEPWLLMRTGELADRVTATAKRMWKTLEPKSFLLVNSSVAV